MNNRKNVLVWNATDGIYASPEYMTDADADKFINEFPKRFAHQGYYLTSKWERIDPSQVVLQKHIDDDDGDEQPPELDHYTLPNVYRDEDELLDAEREQREVEQDDFFHFACLWIPNIEQILTLPIEKRKPYFVQANNTYIDRRIEY